MKIDVLKVGVAMATLAMLTEAVAPQTFWFLPVGGGSVEQFAVFLGTAYVIQELVSAVGR